MKKTPVYKIILLAFICFISTAAAAQTDDSAAGIWVKKGEWRNGLKLNLYAGIDNVEFARQYQHNKALWDEALAFIRNTQLDTLSPGKHIIDGDNVFATVSDGATNEYDKTGWESHRKYIDLHLMINGKERIGVMDPAIAIVTKPYDAVKDVANYAASTHGDYYVADTGTLLIFFPKNAHRPGIHVDGYDKVKKLVVKIKTAD